MPKRSRNSPLQPADASPFSAKRRKSIPHEFVLDTIASLSPRTRPMFGCLAIYVEDKIVFILRDKPNQTEDNGVWLATTAEHHATLQRDFPSMRSIKVLGKKITGWQVLPAEAQDFEEAALRACDLVLAGDPRIGKIPGQRQARVSKKTTKRARQGGRKQKLTNRKIR
jgi:hypothetical protein